MKTTTPSYQLIADMFELMNEGSDEALQFIKDIAKNHSCPVVRHEAVYCLSEIPSKDSIEFLKNLLESDSSYVVKHEALVTLGTIGSVEDIPFIEKYVKDSIPEVADSARVGIQRIRDNFDYEEEVLKNKVDFIEELHDFSSETQNRRIQIIFQLMILGAQGDKESVDSIYFSLTHDPSTIVRHEAGYAMGEVGTEYAFELMEKALKKETSPIVIHETLFALGTTGLKSALLTIRMYLENENYIISESAKIAEGRILHLKKPYSGVRENL